MKKYFWLSCLFLMHNISSMKIIPKKVLGGLKKTFSYGTKINSKQNFVCLERIFTENEKGRILEGEERKLALITFFNKLYDNRLLSDYKRYYTELRELVEAKKMLLEDPNSCMPKLFLEYIKNLEEVVQNCGNHEFLLGELEENKPDEEGTENLESSKNLENNDKESEEPMQKLKEALVQSLFENDKLQHENDLLKKKVGLLEQQIGSYEFDPEIH